VQGDGLLEGITRQIVERTGIAPGPTEIFPARFVKRQFHFCQCVVVADGTGSYDLVFALYDRSEEAQPRCVGHYRWAMLLTAHSNRRTP